MTERLLKIFGEIPEGKIFADVACDHGYIAKAMISAGKCEKVYISDISEKSLEKARTLLKEYIESGKAESFVSDGFAAVPPCDVALVAGIGGALTVNILKSAPFLPDKLVLSPMRNLKEVRKTLIRKGYKILKDFTVFADGEYYEIIVSEKGKDELSKDEEEFGRTNLEELPQAFKDKMRIEYGKLISYSEREGISEKAKRQLQKKAERYLKYV